MGQGKLITTGIVVFVALIAILIFSNATFLTIEAGERGVLFKRFGGGLDKENIYDPGFHVIAAEAAVALPPGAEASGRPNE